MLGLFIWTLELYYHRYDQTNRKHALMLRRTNGINEKLLGVVPSLDFAHHASRFAHLDGGRSSIFYRRSSFLSLAGDVRLQILRGLDRRCLDLRQSVNAVDNLRSVINCDA